MLWPEYWHYQNQHLREQILAAQTELKDLPPTAASFQKLERSARHALRSYLRQCVRRATGRILLRHPDGILRSFSVARKLRRFVLHQCRVRMQARIGPSGNAEYPEQVRTLPTCFTKQQSVMVSDKERTILDALRQPQYAGGIPEVAKALWMSRADIKIPRLLDYVQHFSSGALRRRLGFLLELYEMASPEQLKPLRSKLTSTYDRLDPTLPKSGSFQARWRLQLNIGIDELEAIPHT